MDGFTSPMQQVFSSLDKMFATMEKVNSSSRNLELDNAMREARNSIGAANEALNQMGQNLEHVNTKSDNLFNSFKRYIGITAAIEGGRRSINTFMGYDDAVRGVMAIKGDGSAEMFNQLDRYTAAFATGGLTKKDIAEGYQFTSLAGWDIAQSTFAMGTMRDVKRVTGQEFGRISDLITDSMTPLGLTVSQLPEFADQMAKTQNIANTNMKEMLEAYQGGAFKGVQTGKMSMPELNAFLGVLGNAGIKGDTAGTQVRNIMNGLYDTSSKTKDILEKMNITTYEDGEARNAFDVLQEFGSKLNQYNDESKKQIISGMFNVYDEVGLNALMLQLDQLGNYKAQIEDSTGALSDMIEIMDGGLGGAFRNALSQFNIWMSGLGSALEPLGMMVFFLLQTDLAGTLFSTIQVLAGGIGMLSAVLMVLFAAIDPLSPLIWGLVGAMGVYAAYAKHKALITSIETLATQKGTIAKIARIATEEGLLKATLMTIPVLLQEAYVKLASMGPMWLVIAAIVATGLVLIALSQKFDGVRVTMVRFINSLINGVNWLLEQVSKIPIIGDKIGDFRIKQLDEETALKFNKPFEFEMPEMTEYDDMMGQMPDISFPDKFDIGNVDRVGRVDSNREVNISDEDIRLMRDVAMKEALVQYNTIKLEQKNSFGDVHETADVDGILDRMNRMLDEEIAVSTELTYTV